MGIIIKINSNGTMIDQETVDWLKTMAPSRINITLYGASSETYKRICGRADGFEKAKKAIIMLKEAGIPVVINASMIPENANDLEGIFEFGRKYDLNTRVATYMFPPARREAEESDSRFTPCESAEIYFRKYRCLLNAEAYEQMLKKQLDKLHHPSEADDEEDWGSDSEYMSCRAGRSTFWISWDGTMTACGMLPFPIKTYPFTESFLECWRKLTEKVRGAKVMQECSNCDKKNLCHPCVAQIYTETGNIDKKAPYLCKLTDIIIEKAKRELEEIGNGNR